MQEWHEQDHPRDEDGKFTDKSGAVGTLDPRKIEYRQNTPYAKIIADDRAREAERERREAEHQKPLTPEENKRLDEYKIPKEPIVRKPEDAAKWKLYDEDFDFYTVSEPQITDDMDKISELTGMPLIGRDYRLKGKASYDRKVNDKRLGGEYRPIGDAVRYTFEHTTENAPAQIHSNLKRFCDMGYRVVAIDNKWNDTSAYNGINVDIISPSGVPMEVQFTTRENHKIKEEMHRFYEISRDKRTPEDIRELAERKMILLETLWKKPKGIEEV